MLFVTIKCWRVVQTPVFHQIHASTMSCEGAVAPKDPLFVLSVYQLLRPFCFFSIVTGHLMQVASTLYAFGRLAASGFFAFLRSGEFTCRSWSSYTSSVLSLEDIAIDNRHNPTLIYLTLKHSKSDIFSAGVTIYVGRTNNILCPVSALLAYLAICPSTPGPLFLLSSGNLCQRIYWSSLFVLPFHPQAWTFHASMATVSE